MTHSDTGADADIGDVVLDEIGSLCPLPVIALGRAAATNPQRPLLITIWADDPAAQSDIPAWCRMKGAELINVIDSPNRPGMEYRVRLPLAETSD